MKFTTTSVGTAAGAALAAMLLMTAAASADCTSVSGQTQSATTKIPISGVQVRVLPLHGARAVATAVTDKEGQFRFICLDEGAYRLSFSREGYEDVSINVALRLRLSVLVAAVMQKSTDQERLLPPVRPCGDLMDSAQAGTYVVCSGR